MLREAVWGFYVAFTVLLYRCNTFNHNSKKKEKKRRKNEKSEKRKSEKRRRN